MRVVFKRCRLFRVVIRNCSAKGLFAWSGSRDEPGGTYNINSLVVPPHHCYIPSLVSRWWTEAIGALLACRVVNKCLHRSNFILSTLNYVYVLSMDIEIQEIVCRS
jgi:hypothetical protein